MPGEKTETNIATLAPTNTTASTSRRRVETSASILVITSPQPPLTTPPPPITTSHTPAQASESSSYNFFTPLRKEVSPSIAEVSTSDAAVTSPPQLTHFPDLNLQTATLLAQLKNPSLLSTEELQAAIAEAKAALSAWESEWLDIDDDIRQDRGLKPAARMGIRPKSLNPTRSEGNRFFEGLNEQKTSGAGVRDAGLRTAGRAFPAADVEPSSVSVEAEAEIGITTITPLSQTPMQDQAHPLNCGRGQRARKPRKFFGETSPASSDQKRGSHEREKGKFERQTPIAQSLPKQQATEAKPNTSLARKRKREDLTEEGQLAAESSRQMSSLSAIPTQSQQPKIKAKLILNPPKLAPAPHARPVASCTEPISHTTRSMSRAAIPVGAEDIISQAASTSTSAAPSKHQVGGKRKCLHNNDEGEQVLPKAKKMAMLDPTATVSLKKAVENAKHSAIMQAAWARQRANGTGGLYGGQPCAATVEGWKNNMIIIGDFKVEE